LWSGSRSLNLELEDIKIEERIAEMETRLYWIDFFEVGDGDVRGGSFSGIDWGLTG